MRTVVTGSEGFLGKYLVKRLQDDGHEVLGMDMARPPGWSLVPGQPLFSSQPYQQVNITDRDALLGLAKDWAKDADCLVHLAAIAAPRIAEANPTLAWEVNVRGTSNVLEMAHRAGIKRVVFLSSAHTFGISPKYFPTDEVHPLALHDMYTTTKILGEQLCDLYFTNHGLSYLAVKLWNSYGPLQSSDYFLGKTIENAKKGNFELRGGSVTKDWVWVGDTIDAIARAMKSDFVGAVNVGTGVETSLREMATMIAEFFGVTFKEVPESDFGPTRMRCDWSRARRVLGWEPKVDVKEGLRRTMEAAGR